MHIKGKTTQSGLLIIGFLLMVFQNWAQVNQTPESNKRKEVQFPAAAQFANSKITYQIIPAANKTWCYDIIADGKMIIHQPSVPGLSGNEGFKTKTVAQKVAGLVIQKIKMGAMPPSITKAEMQKVGAL